MTELILECCGKPESQCSCDEPNSDERLFNKEGEMSRETLKQRILDELCVDGADWRLAKEIYSENKDRLKERIGLSDIYNRIKDLRANPKSIYKYPYGCVDKENLPKNEWQALKKREGVK